jgi:NAD(P)-dependent dehydrogenase (short-subunit alcohol dehydrogenase family)
VRPRRSNSRTPKRSSSPRTCWATAPWLTPSSSAASRKWRWRDAASNARIAFSDGRSLVLIHQRLAVLSSSGKGEALAQELGGFGVTGSNQSTADLERLVDGTLERWGRIDVLVSAGHGPRAPILELTDEQWLAGMETYFMNVVRPVRLVTPVMERQGGGAMVNISTAWVDEPSHLFPPPRCSATAWPPTRTVFANTYAAANIRVNNVLPGWIDSLPATEERRLDVPMQRYGASDEAAGAIAFLVSSDASYITRQSIRVDGGVIRAL